MKDWSDLKRFALRAQPFNSTDYAVTSLGSCASKVLELIAENESLRKAVSWAIQVHRDPELEHEIRHEEWLEDLEAAISSPENP